MYFDFDDYHPETPTIEPAISRREGIALSVMVHVAALLLILYAPRLPFLQRMAEEARQAALERQLALEQAARENAQFVFVQPRLDMPALKAPPRAELSDKDRMARTLERPPNPTNPMPFMRGNTSERIEAQDAMKAAGRGPSAEPAAPASTASPSPPSESVERAGGLAYDAGRGTPVPRADVGQARGGTPGGSLGDALRNLQRYTQSQSFDNPQGGTGAFGPAIQFDTKGVEFGPWIRRFIAQIKRNWNVPYAAMSLSGHVVLTFNVHKDGSITDLTVVAPSSVDGFNNAAFNALLASDPTQPLPPEYPSDKAFFTVTFYYNEMPPGR